jgi:hypothetical protein
MDKELFDYLSDLKIENIKLKKQMQGFTDRGINKYFERKCDILIDALNAIDRAKIPLVEPRVADVFRDTEEKISRLKEEFEQLGEL